MPYRWKNTMRISMKTAALVATLAGVAAFVFVEATEKKSVVNREVESQGSARAAALQGPNAAVDPAAENQHTFALPERSGLGEPRAKLFSPESWQASAPKISAPPPPPPSAPPMPYKFVGRLLQEGRLTVFLSKGDSVFPAKEGETLDGTYRVDAIRATQIDLVYLPLGQTQSVSIVFSLSVGAIEPAAASKPLVAVGATSSSASTQTGAAPVADARALIPASRVISPRESAVGAATARLMWDGPPQVKVGTRFEITLRANSEQPLHAWPMQLRFDPAQFEVVTVKAGKLPGGPDPSFTYRVNPDGAIFVGASVQQAAPASNAELLAITLRPMKAAPAAELSIASLNLEGAAGRPIPHDRISTFKTAIMP
jgi:hypothetical protein